jgi:MOSC domain-containing protein YiiM
MDSRETADAVAGHGLEGCAHARPGSKRQVLFVSADHLRAVGIDPGTIKENLTVEGADVQAWPIGQRVQAGDAVFEVTLECEPCQLMEEIRPGLQAELDGRRGMLARVVETGRVSIGDELRLL